MNRDFQEPKVNHYIRMVFVLFFFSAEIKNLQCHIHLRDIKVENKGERAIPTKHGYELVSMANYFWEFLCWVFF